jgi:hypothetical protein
MTEHKGLPVAGYKKQSDDNVQTVNVNKIMEERLLRRLEELMSSDNHDKRMLSIAKTEIQSAFMWMNRAVFQPARITLPEDHM